MLATNNRLLIKHKLPPSFDLWGREPSPTAATIRVRYENAGLRGWNTQRISKLCNKLGMTPEEIMAYCGVWSKTEARKMWQYNDWPPPVALHLLKLEAFAYSSALPDEQDRIAGAFLNRWKHNFQHG